MSADPPTPEQGPSQQGPQINVSVPDELRHGAYANFLVLSHSPHEFTLDFCQVMPSREQGKVQAEVVSRLKVAPTLVGKLIQALNTNMTAYEDKYGMVRDVG